MTSNDMRRVQGAHERAGAELRAAPYPTREDVRGECDLVMKGGISSGVVYPLAVCELAQNYWLRRVGGSSAGAIAAALAAAAEHGRDRGGFQRLEALPDEIAPRLPELIQPAPHTKLAHAVVMELVDREPPRDGQTAKARRTSIFGKLWRVLGVLVGVQRAFFWPVFGVTALILVGLAVLASGVPDGVAIAGFAALVLILLGVAFATAVGTSLVRAGWATWHGLGRHGFGICVGSVGSSGTASDESHELPLTDWLAARIDSVAGVSRPLTFGDIESQGIELKVTTTNLTLGHAETFPFRKDDVLFDPDELGDYFSPEIIDQLKGNRAPASSNGAELQSPEGATLYDWPRAAEVPIVVAARLSLSFPGLISAVPLYKIDRSREQPVDQAPVRCWFSDGGITSNFPVTFFDSLWPTRPTFALDLSSHHPDHPERDVYYGGSTLRYPRTKQIDSMGAFLAAILDTMQYWADDAQAALPGYRDRIVEVHLSNDEGGMNLRMPEDTVLRVAGKGRAAAAELVARFDFDEHRWTRYLTGMEELQEVLGLLKERYPDSDAGAKGGYRDLIAAAPDRVGQRRDAQWAADAQRRTEALLAFMESDVPDFGGWSPGPHTVLRINPEL